MTASGTARGDMAYAATLIFFVGPAHDDPERIVRQWPLQRLRFIPIDGQDRRRSELPHAGGKAARRPASS